MLCNEEDKQSIKENHRQRYRTLLNATTSTLHTSILPTTQEEIIPFIMEEQNTGAKPRLITSIWTTYKQEELLFSLYRIIRKQAEPHTTNRIKHAHTANKTLYTSTLYTSTRTTTIQEKTGEQTQESK